MVIEKDVAALIALLEQNGFEVYVDGGWPVDAVLGEQTRGRGIRYDASGATKTRSITPNWPEVRSISRPPAHD